MAKKDFMGLMKQKTVDIRPSILTAEESIKQQIIELPELRELIPPLSEDELNQLEENLLQHGVKDPLTIWETTDEIAGIGQENKPVYILIDGHNRRLIIKRHNLDYRINLSHFASLNEAKDYMINYQLGRRNLKPDQVRYLRGIRYNHQKLTKGENLQTENPVTNTAELLAREYGVSSRTIRRDGVFAQSIDKLATPLKQEVLTGKKRLSKTTLDLLEKAEPTVLIENIDEWQAQPLATEPTTKVVHEDSMATLIVNIRKLANGPLPTKDCLILKQYLDELVSLRATE